MGLSASGTAIQVPVIPTGTIPSPTDGSFYSGSVTETTTDGRSDLQSARVIPQYCQGGGDTCGGSNIVVGYCYVDDVYSNNSGASFSKDNALSVSSCVNNPQTSQAAHVYVTADFYGTGNAVPFILRATTHFHNELGWGYTISGTTVAGLPTDIFGVPAQGSVQAPAYRLGDFDGDGQTDILLGSDFGNYLIRWNGTGFYAVPVALSPSNFVNLKGSQGHTVVSGDFDGDGRTDLLVLNWTNPGAGAASPYSSTLLRWNGSAFLGTNASNNIPPATYAVSGNSYSSALTGLLPLRHTVGDFNGDGKADFVLLRVKSQTTADVVVVKSSGNSFNASTIATDVTFWLDAGGIARSRLYAGDLDGDGRSDLLVHNRVFFPRGLTYVAMDAPLSPVADFNNSTQPVPMGDLDGDGRQDLAIVTGKNPGGILGQDYSGTIQRISVGSPFPDLMIQAQQPFGGQARLEYWPSSSWTNDRMSASSRLSDR